VKFIQGVSLDDGVSWDLGLELRYCQLKDPTPELIITHLPLALASGHGRYIQHSRYARTDAVNRWGMAVTYQWFRINFELFYARRSP
jgi:hypothetical protein